MTTIARVLAAFLLLVLLAPASSAGSGGAGVQPDGTILVLDRIESGPHAKHVVAAFGPDGKQDSSYGVDGAVNIRGYAPPALAVLPDGRARVLTSSRECDETVDEICSDYLAFERLSTGGRREGRVGTWGDFPEFSLNSVALAAGADGLFLLSADFQAVASRDFEGDHPSGSDAVRLDRDGGLTGVVAAGSGVVAYGPGRVVRLDAELAPVDSFGEDGVVAPPLTVRAAVADGDGLLLAGDGAVARLLADGSPDPDFGDGGVAALPVAAAATSAIVVASDGTVTTGATKDGDFVVQRLTPAGEPDAGFGGDGAAVVSFDVSDQLRDLVSTEDGGVVATGATHVAGGDRRFALARLTAAGELDPEFGEGGRVTASADVTPPAIVFDEAPPEGGVFDGESVRIAVRPEPGASFSCQSFECDEPILLAVSSGPNSIRVTAVDRAGNGADKYLNFFVAPRTRRLAGPPASTQETSASFTWESANPTPYPNTSYDPTFQCRLDSGEWSACESGHTVTGLADGEHSFEVRQWLPDHSGKPVFEVEPERWSWTVDTRLEEPVKPTPPGGGGGPGPGAPLVPEPPVFVPPTLEQQLAAARAGLKTSVKRSGRLRRAKAVSLDVGSAVKASVRVTGSMRMTGRRRAIALRAFSGQVDAGRSVRAKLRLSKAARALLRRRGGPRTVVVRLKVTLADSGGRSLATRSIRARVRR